MDILLFVVVSVGVILIPGPNVLVIIATSVSSGKARGLQTVFGTSCAMLIQLGIAALATAYFVDVLASGFVWLKWFGVAYLLYLGITNIRSAILGSVERQVVSAIGSFQRGFWVSLTNPKTILFFSAFLPQFAPGSSPYFTQILALSAIFWSLALSLDSMFSILSSKLHKYVVAGNVGRFKHGFSGLLYLGAGSMLAGVKDA